MGRLKVTKNKNRFSKLIAIVGPSASGKTSLANRLEKKLGAKQVTRISQDQYYKDCSVLPIRKRKEINFDKPSAFDFTLMQKHLKKLKMNKDVLAPCYSYILHKRLSRKIITLPKKIFVAEGLLLLHKKYLRNLFDLKIYLDIDNATSLSRRIRRDLEERGETVYLICKRYFNDVLPMQKKYVEPQKKWADVVVDGNRKLDGKLINKLAQKFIG